MLSANNFLQKKDTASCLVSFSSDRQDASNDMHFDPTVPARLTGRTAHDAGRSGQCIMSAHLFGVQAGLIRVSG